MLNCVQTGIRSATMVSTDSNPSVLIIDDDYVAASELAETLELEGFNCVAVSSSEQAISILCSFPSIDVVITDFYLEGKATATRNGLTLIERIRDQFSSRTLEFIVISGDQDVLTDCIITGAGQFLAKPIAPESICSMVRDASFQAPQEGALDDADDHNVSLHQMVQTQAETIASLTHALDEARTDNRKASSGLDRLVSAASIARKCNDDVGTTDLDVLLRYVVGQGYAVKKLISGNAKAPQQSDAVTITPINS